MSLGEHEMMVAIRGYMWQRPFDMPELWAEFIAYRERMGLTFSFQTAQECIDAFHAFQMTHLEHWDEEWPYEGAQPVKCQRCGQPWPQCGHELNDHYRAYET